MAHPALLHYPSIARILKFAAQDLQHAEELSEVTHAWFDCSLRHSAAMWDALINNECEVREAVLLAPLIQQQQWQHQAQQQQLQQISCKRHRRMARGTAEPPPPPVMPREATMKHVLFWAARKGRYSVIEILVGKHNVSPNCCVEKEIYDINQAWTPLHEACRHQQPNSITSLVLCGANYNARYRSDVYGRGATPLHSLCERACVGGGKKEESIKALFFSVAEYRSYMKANLREQIDERKRQLQLEQQRDGDDNRGKPAAAAAATGAAAASSKLERATAGNLMARLEAADDDEEIDALERAQSLLRNDFAAFKLVQRSPLLMHAKKTTAVNFWSRAQSGDIPLAGPPRLDLNAMASLVTPLVILIQAHAPATEVQLLLDAGASVTLRTSDSMNTPLMWCVVEQQTAIAKVLLAHESFQKNAAAANAIRQPDLVTALHLAVSDPAKMSPKLVQTLLHYGANPNAVDAKQRKPVAYAQQFLRGNCSAAPKVVELLSNPPRSPTASRSPLQSRGNSPSTTPRQREQEPAPPPPRTQQQQREEAAAAGGCAPPSPSAGAAKPAAGLVFVKNNKN